MPIKQVTKTLYECLCACKQHPNCPRRFTPWTAEIIPARCASCGCRTWNRDRRISKKRMLTFNGETLSISEWALKLELDKRNVYWRIRQGWPIEQILSRDDWRTNKAGGDTSNVTTD